MGRRDKTEKKGRKKKGKKTRSKKERREREKEEKNDSTFIHFITYCKLSLQRQGALML